MKSVVTFGEIMLRLSPPGHLRYCQAHELEVNFGGGEANVATSLSRFGIPADYVTRLPQNDIGDMCLMYLREHGVGTRHILRGGNRMGVYFLENGAVQRGSKVIYDREHSAIAEMTPGMADWGAIFAEADWFHVTGITPAISESAADTTIEALLAARSRGITVSCDLNYRKNLWKWGKKASEVMPELVRLSDIIIANEEDIEKTLEIASSGVNVVDGLVEAEPYRLTSEEVVRQYPNVKTIAITLRGSISASHNTWTGVLWRGGDFFTTRKYDITHIVDRVGSGDAFAGGLIYGLKKGLGAQSALDFASAASCIKHSIWGDANLTTLEEVEKLMKGDASGRVSR